MERAPKRPEGSPSPAVVWNRLRELQTLCGRDTGLLFISGVDGKFNIGCTRAINFVVSGSSGREICQQMNEDLEDVSFVVSSHSSLPYRFYQAVLVISANGSFLHVGSSDVFWKLMVCRTRFALYRTRFARTVSSHLLRQNSWETNLH